MQSSSSPRTQHARRPSAFVVRDPAPEDVGARVDWSAWYLTDEEDSGQTVEQSEIIRILLSTLSRHLVARAPVGLPEDRDHRAGDRLAVRPAHDLLEAGRRRGRTPRR